MHVGRPMLFGLLLAATAYAQKCVVTGHVFDAQHVPVSGAKVSLQEAGRKELSNALTDSRGVYRFTVSSGRYTVRAENVQQGPFAVAENAATNIDLVLDQANFFDEPQFVVAGVTDNTYRGGHGADTMLRSSEVLSKAAASLSTVKKDPADPVKAVQELQRTAEASPTEAHLFDWGTELLVHQAPQPASEVFARGVRGFPGSTRMLVGLATAWYAAGSYQQAGEWFFKATDVDPNDPGPYLFLGQVEAKEITESAGYEARMARFARLQPRNAQANYLYAMTLWRRRTGPEDWKTLGGVRALLETAVAIDPQLGPAYLQLGVVAVAEYRYLDAIHAYQKAVAIDPDLTEAHYRLSEAYRLTSDRARSQEELQIYRRLSKQSAETIELERREVQRFVVALRSQHP